MYLFSMFLMLYVFVQHVFNVILCICLACFCGKDIAQRHGKNLLSSR